MNRALLWKRGTVYNEMSIDERFVRKFVLLALISKKKKVQIMANAGNIIKQER